MRITLSKPITRVMTGVVATIITPKGMVEIYQSVHSGKVITRSKVKTWTGVLHPGIVIGEDKFGNLWVAHNHYKKKRPTFDILSEYLDGEDFIWDKRPTIYTLDQIVDRTIKEVIRGRRYSFVNYNCQTFVNRIVRNKHTSESIDNLSKGATGFGLLLTVAGVAIKSKALVFTGLATVIIAGSARGYSKVRF